jgi:hypothetical protein
MTYGPLFIKTDRIAVFLEDDPDNIIFVLSKMNYGVKARLENEMAQITANDAKNVRFTIGSYQLALLRLNILDWQGPAFTGMKCTPENINLFDPDHPLIVKVLERISEQNRKKESPDPKLAERNGSSSDGNQSLTESLSVA